MTILTEAAILKPSDQLRTCQHCSGEGVAYVGAGRVVRHYLIAPSDVMGPKRTVVDFLLEQSQFQSLLQVCGCRRGRA